MIIPVYSTHIKIVLYELYTRPEPLQLLSSCVAITWVSSHLLTNQLLSIFTQVNGPGTEDDGDGRQQGFLIQ